MPSGKIHDAITFVLAIPAAAVAYRVTDELATAVLVAVCFVFGGIMFGPDLDTVSRQYSRWSVFKVIWYPYRAFFSHRSRFTHGLVFGALFRVVYFLGAVTLLAGGAAVIAAVIEGATLPSLQDLMRAWAEIGTAVRGVLGSNFYIPVFAGLWLGAASHTFTDMAGSYITTGRPAKLF